VREDTVRELIDPDRILAVCSDADIAVTVDTPRELADPV
jgi:hypothetical protein